MSPITYGQFNQLATKDDIRSTEKKLSRKIEEVVAIIHELFLMSQGAEPQLGIEPEPSEEEEERPAHAESPY
jgi:hypothetical protein